MDPEKQLYRILYEAPLQSEVIPSFITISLKNFGKNKHSLLLLDILCL